MKKIFSIMIALLAMAFVSNAQALLSEGFESGTLPTGWTTIDNDNDTYTWDPAYGFDGHNGGLCISSASFINGVGALTPDNWLITPAINLTANATLTFWVCGQDASYANEHYGVYISTTGTAISNFTLIYEETINAAGGSRDQGSWKQKTVNLASYTGQTVYIAFRHFNCTDEYWLNLDDVEIFAQPTTSTIDVNPATVTFPITPVGNTAAAQTVTVNGFVLTAGITATTAAPFAVSADGTTYGTTATLPSTGGTLYVQYAPTAAGPATGNITLSSTGAADVTIALAGEGVDCSGSVSVLPWTEDFSGNVFPPLCWDLIPTSTTNTWDVFEYSGYWASCSGDDAGTQHEELITKTFDFTNYTGSVLLDLDFMSNYSYISDGTCDLQLFASTDGGTTFGTTPIWSLSQESQFDNWTSTTATINLSSLAGQANVVLDFVFVGNTCQILFTNLNMYAISDPTINAEVETLNYYAEVGTTDIQTVNVVAYNMTAAPVATTAAPFAVSADGTTFGTTATLPMDGGVLYVQYTGTSGDQTGNVTISAAGATDVVVALNGTGYTCGGFPISEDFNHAGFLPGCWTLTYADDPTINPMIVLPVATGSDDYAFRFSSYNTAEDYNQYLISPMIESNDELMISLDYMIYTGSEKFKVGYSTTGNDVADFTWLSPVNATATSWTTYEAGIPQGAKYIAINYFSNYLYYLYIDNIEIKTNTSVEEHAQSAVRVYPNPASDFVTIAADANITSVEIYNMAGQKVIAVDANDVTTTVNTTTLAKGMYTVRINTVNGTVNQKFAVAR